MAQQINTFRRRSRVRAVRMAAALSVLALLMLVRAEQATAEFFTFSTIVAPVNTVTGGGVTITLTPGSVNTPGDNLDATAPGTDIVFGSISVTGLTLSSILEPINIPYNFQVSVSNYLGGTDVIPTGPPVVFNISGVLTGSVGGGKKLNIANSFTFNTITQDVGGELYHFSSFSYVPPGVFNAGAFGAHVEVGVPEPGTFALLGLGALCLATPALRRMRRTSQRTSG